MSNFRLDSESFLADCDLAIKSCEFVISSHFCIGSQQLKTFVSAVPELIHSNSGTALLESYTEESRLTLTALGNASSSILIGGNISSGSLADDLEIFGQVAFDGARRSGIELRFGGFRTDQSYLSQDIAAFWSLLKAMKVESEQHRV